MTKRKTKAPECGLRHHFFVKNKTPYDHAKEAKEPPPLTKQETAKVQRNVGLMREHCPEVESFIKALHAEGMIDGYRAIVSVTKLRRAK